MKSSDLKVYRDIYDLFHLVLDVLENFPKLYKYTLGERIQDNLLDTMENIERANKNMKKRVYYIEEARCSHDIVTMLLRLSFERKAIPISKYTEICKLTEGIGKQLTGWASFTKDGKNSNGQGC